MAVRLPFSAAAGSGGPVACTPLFRWGFLDQPMHEHGQFRVRQYLVGHAAEQQLSPAAAAMRAHENQVAMLQLRHFHDFQGRAVGKGRQARRFQAPLGGRVEDGLPVVGARLAHGDAVFLLAGIAGRNDFDVYRVLVFGCHVHGKDVGVHLFGKGNAGTGRQVGDGGAVRGDQNFLIHGRSFDGD